ncbi:beta strand repeat-containing protein [Rariglobus hedericola]|uniref:beta strand repeat-containing protein n=1 Tax=Rariglobus hedericola TaxID=2597822 RepID=UPI001939308B|nr:hypothetical protein [Rariglobus hedericola]
MTATNLRLQANGAIGTNIRHLTTNIDVLTALASTGSIFITEDNGATVDTVTVTVTEFSSTATTSDVVDLNQSDLTTSTNGSIVLVVTLGNLTLNDGLVNGTAVSANGTGNILLTTLAVGSDILVNADINSGSGHVTVIAPRDLTFASGADVTTTTGTINLESGRNIAFDANARALTTTGNIRFLAANNITLGGVNSTSGDITLTATAGSILAAGHTYKNISGRAVRLVSAIGIGSSSDALQTAIATLTASTGANGISLIEDDGLTIDTVAVTVQSVLSDGTTVDVVTGNQADLVTTGSLALQILSGALTLNDGFDADNIALSVTGNIRLNIGGNITANADLVSSTGHITVLATGTMTFNALADVITSAAATTVNIESGAAILFAANARILTNNGNVRILGTTGDITLGGVQAGTALVSITATTGSILDGGDFYQNVTASALRLVAGNAIGSSSNVLETGIDTLTAIFGTGGLHLTNDDSLTIDTVAVVVSRVLANFTAVAEATDVNQSDLTGTGAINLTLTTGNFILNDGLDADNIAITTAGTVTLTALDTDSTLTVNADIVSTATNVVLNFDDTITLNTTADIRAGGTVSITSVNGAFTMTDGTEIVSTGSTTVDVTGIISLSRINAGTSAINLTTDASIIDVLTAETPNLSGGLATIRAVGNFGTTTGDEDIDTQLASLDVIISGTGTIVIDEVDALNVVNATTTDGFISLDTVGDLAIQKAVAGGNSNILLTVGGNLTVRSVTATANTITANVTGSIEPITGGVEAEQLNAATLVLNAGTGIGAGTQLVVRASTLTLITTTGDIDVRNLFAGTSTILDISTGGTGLGTGTINYEQTGGPLTIVDGSTNDGDISITLGTGNLIITELHAGGDGDIFVTVTGAGGVSLGDVTAGGGDIRVSTSDTIVLDQDVTTNGENLTFTGDVRLGADVTITTSGGNLTFDDTLDGNFSLVINTGAGDVEFNAPVGATIPLAGLDITSLGDIAINSTLTVAGDTAFHSATLTVTGGPNSISTTNGGTFLAEPIDGTLTMGIGALGSSIYGYVIGTNILNALAPGFGSVTFGRADGTGHVDVGTATFRSPTVIRTPGVGGSLNIVAGSTVTVTGNNSLDLIAGSGDAGVLTMEAGAVITAGSGTVTLTADVVTLNGAAGSIQGTGRLVLQPSSVGRDIVVGAAGTASQFDLTLAELAVVATGFTELVIGRLDGEHAISVFTGVYRSAVTFRAPAGNGTVSILGNVSTTRPAGNITALAGADVLVSANLTTATGNIVLTADADLSGAGDLLISQTAINVIRANQGNLVFKGDSVILGTASTRADIYAVSGNITMTADVNGDGTGALILANAQNQLKAGGNLTLSTGTTAPTTDTLISLSGVVLVLGNITITSAGTITGEKISLVGYGAVSISSAESIIFESGLITSRNASTTLSADTDHDGSGDVILAANFNVIVQANTTATISGDEVIIGSATGFGRVVTLTGDIFIRSNFNQDTRGRFFVVNSQSRLSAGGSLFIGEVSYGSGTPYEISIQSAQVTVSRDVAFYSVTNVTLDGSLFTVTRNARIFAYGNIVMSGGELLTNGTLLALEADVDRDDTGSVTLSGNARLTNRTAVTITGYTVTRGPNVTITPNPTITQLQ